MLPLPSERHPMHDDWFIYLIYANALLVVACVIWFIYLGGD